MREKEILLLREISDAQFTEIPVIGPEHSQYIPFLRTSRFEAALAAAEFLPEL